MPNPNVLLVLNQNGRASQVDLDKLIVTLKKRGITELYVLVSGSVWSMPNSPEKEQAKPSQYRWLQQFAQHGITAIPITELDPYYAGNNFYLDHINFFARLVVEEGKTFCQIEPGQPIPPGLSAENNRLIRKYQHACQAEQELSQQMKMDERVENIKASYLKLRPHPIRVYDYLRTNTSANIPLVVIGNDPQELVAIQDYHNKCCSDNGDLFTTLAKGRDRLWRSSVVSIDISADALRFFSAMWGLAKKIQELELYIRPGIPVFTEQERAEQIIVLRNAFLEAVTCKLGRKFSEADVLRSFLIHTQPFAAQEAEAVAYFSNLLENCHVQQDQDLYFLVCKCKSLIELLCNVSNPAPENKMAATVQQRVHDIMQSPREVWALMQRRIAANNQQTKVVEYYNEAVSDEKRVLYYQPAGVEGDDIPTLCVLPRSVYAANSVILEAGDIHGNTQNVYQIIAQYEDLKQQEKKVFVIFKGDLVDRAPAYTSSIEALVTVRCFQEMYPNDVFVIPGNHDLMGSLPNHKPHGMLGYYPSQNHFWNCELSTNASTGFLPVSQDGKYKVLMPPATTVLNTLPQEANDVMRDTIWRAAMTDPLAIRYPCDAQYYMLVVHGAPLALQTTENARIRLKDLLHREQLTWGEKLPPYGTFEHKNENNEPCKEGDTPRDRRKGLTFGDQTRRNLQGSGDCGCSGGHSHYNSQAIVEGYTFRTTCSTDLGTPAQIHLCYGTGNGFDHQDVDIAVVDQPQFNYPWQIIEQFFAEAANPDELMGMCRRVICEKIVKTDNPLAITNISFINECLLIFLINLRVATIKFNIRINFDIENAIESALQNKCHEILAGNQELSVQVLAFIDNLNDLLISAERAGKRVNGQLMKHYYFTLLHMVKGIFENRASPEFIEQMHREEINSRREKLNRALDAFTYDDWQRMYQMLAIINHFVSNIEIGRNEQEGFQRIEDPIWVSPRFVRCEGGLERFDEYIHLCHESTELWKKYDEFSDAFSSLAPEDDESRAGLNERFPLLCLFRNYCALSYGSFTTKERPTLAAFIDWIDNSRKNGGKAQPIEDLHRYAPTSCSAAEAVAVQRAGRSETEAAVTHEEPPQPDCVVGSDDGPGLPGV